MKKHKITVFTYIFVYNNDIFIKCNKKLTNIIENIVRHQPFFWNTEINIISRH